MAWVTAVRTGCGALSVEWTGRAARRGDRWTFNGEVLGPGQWNRVRADISVNVLMDEHGLTREQAINAVVPASVLWSYETGNGDNEWNFNVSNLHCTTADATGGDCVRFSTSRETLQSFLHTPRQPTDLVEGVRAFWSRVARIELALRHLGGGGDLTPLEAPTGPWARVPDASARSLWETVWERLSDGREEVRVELPPNPYAPGGQRARVGGSSRGSRGRTLAAFLVVGAAAWAATGTSER